MKNLENLISNNITLIEGEKVVWTGQPELTVFTWIDWVRLPFLVIWLSIAVFVAYNAISISGTAQALKNGGSFFIVWTLIIASIGTYSIVGSYVNEYLAKKELNLF